MPTLVIDNVPASLYDRIQRVAKAEQRTAADTALAALASAFRTATPTLAQAPLPQEPFLTEEICAPCVIPWPKGTPVHAVHVDPPLPTAHDVPEED